MKFKSNTELKLIIEDSNEDVLLPKKKAIAEIERRATMSLDELNYELNLIQTKNITSINNIMIVFLVLSIIAIFGSTVFLYLSDKA